MNPDIINIVWLRFHRTSKNAQNVLYFKGDVTILKHASKKLAVTNWCYTKNNLEI